MPRHGDSRSVVIIYGDGDNASQKRAVLRSQGDLGNATPRALDTKSRTAVHTSVIPRRCIPVALRRILVFYTLSYPWYVTLHLRILCLLLLPVLLSLVVLLLLVLLLQPAEVSAITAALE